MAKLVLDDLVNLSNQPSAIATINSNSAAIEDALENTLSRDGTSPNQMSASLDMNNNRITNLPAPASGSEPIRLSDIDDGELAIADGFVDAVEDAAADALVAITAAEAASIADIDVAEAAAIATIDAEVDAAVAAAVSGLDLVEGPASATDLAAARWDLTTGELLQDSVLLIADTTGDLSRSGNGGIDIQGTNTNDDAPSGYIGEVQIAGNTAVALTTNTPVNLCSVSLTAGDWDVSALVAFNGAGATITSNLNISLSTTSATQDTTFGRQSSFRYGTGITDCGHTSTISPYRFQLTATTTIYLVATVIFTTSTYQAGSARLHARRVR